MSDHCGESGAHIVSSFGGSWSSPGSNSQITMTFCATELYPFCEGVSLCHGWNVFEIGSSRLTRTWPPAVVPPAPVLTHLSSHTCRMCQNSREALFPRSTGSMTNAETWRKRYV